MGFRFSPEKFGSGRIIAIVYINAVFDDHLGDI